MLTNWTLLAILIIVLIIAVVLIFFLTPTGQKLLGKKYSTNYDDAIGKEVRVVEAVDNFNGTGKVLYNNLEWSAKAQDDSTHFAVDESALVVEIRGVNMILAKVQKNMQSSE